MASQDDECNWNAQSSQPIIPSHSATPQNQTAFDSAANSGIHHQVADDSYPASPMTLSAGLNAVSISGASHWESKPVIDSPALALGSQGYLPDAVDLEPGAVAVEKQPDTDVERAVTDR
ncbi:hypothetical protein BJY04DRAFT_217526 [Aspergillus karnatakaensis]|uniref:uncharacterized protein n=1 Tax=Aspergillus karnatakaensis TaxID=1810916 RepID=UPI003CCCE568